MASCNGTLEPGETCDGANLNGHSCTEFGYSNGAGLACSSCMLSAAGCIPTCGDGKKEPGEACDDGNVANYDGCNSSCQVEGPGTVCKTAIPVALNLGTTTLNGTTVGGGSHAGSGNACISAGTDLVYAVTPASNGFITAALPRNATLYDSVLYVSTACSDIATNTSLLCADSQDPNNIGSLQGGEVVSFYATANTTYYLFVDGRSTAGTFQLTIDLSLGNGCADPVPLPIWPGSGMTILGTNYNAGNDTQGNCGMGNGMAGSTGEDVVYQVSRQGAGPLTFTTIVANTNFNTVLYARNSCGGNQYSCNDANGNGAAETLSYMNVNADLFFFVDGSVKGGGNIGGQANSTYGITITP
jgi:cysteine-rich repeat protein